MAQDDRISGIRLRCMSGLNYVTRQVFNQTKGLTNIELELLPQSVGEMYVGVSESDLMAAIQAMLYLSIYRVKKRLEGKTPQLAAALKAQLKIRVRVTYVHGPIARARISVWDNAGRLSAEDSGQHRIGPLIGAISRATSPDEPGSSFKPRSFGSINMMVLTLPRYTNPPQDQLKTG